MRKYPSGGISIDIRLNELFVTIQSSTAGEYGVSRVGGNDVGVCEHDHVFNDASDVIAHLKTVLP